MTWRGQGGKGNRKLPIIRSKSSNIEGLISARYKLIATTESSQLYIHDYLDYAWSLLLF